MFTILREHRYRIQIGSETRILRIEELVSGPAVWEKRFRLQIPAEPGFEAKTIYGSTDQETAELAAEFFDGRGAK
jgi:hypothetical protein